MDTTQLVADAKSLGGTLLGAAKTAGESFISAIGGDAEAAVPKLSTDAENTLLEFVPSFIRPVITSAGGAAVAAVDASAVALIKQGVGIALTRLDQLL